MTCDDLSWQFGDWYSVQRSASPFCLKSGSKVYANDGSRRSATTTASKTEAGAVWLTYYPNIMVEWYPRTCLSFPR